MQPYSQQQPASFRSPQKQYPRLDMVGGKTAYYGSAASSPPSGSGRKYHDSTGTYSETESEPEPLPFCSCDEDYFVRCEYHRGEHHGLSFELAHDFVDLKHLLRTIQEQEVRRYVFQGTQVGKVIEFLTLRHFQMNEVQLNSLTRLIRDKMAHVRQIHLIDALDADFIHQHRVAFRRFCTAIFAVHPVIKYNSMAAELPEEQRGLVKEIAVRECPMDNTFFACIGSAMHYSNTVQNIDLQELMDPAQVKEEDLHLCWGWLVYGLFHPNSTARIEKIDLSRNMMRMKDIRVVEGIMAGGHPALILLIPEYAAALQRYSKSNRDKILREDVKRALLKGIPHRRVFALIKKGITVRPLPTSKLSQHEVYSDLFVEKELLEVFCILRKWLCVVVPGFGLGWVPRQSAIEMTEIGMSPRICSPSTLLRSVSFWNMIEASDAEGMVVPLITLFFQMTGTSDRLEDINLSENRIGSPDQFGIPATEILHRIIYFSPYLTTLNLSDCQLTNITPLLEAYKKGRCRIRSLNLDSNMLGFRGAFDLAMLLISDSQSPLGSWLTDLSLLFNDIDAIGTRALLEALQYNVHLEHLAIEYGNEFPPELGDFEFTGDCATWHENYLFERLAVLRVFERFSLGEPLDENVMHLVWEFLGFDDP
ncbi:hypothetical protein PHYPSEUDO_000306 [Phytophthora pseudosyringae]|uniref:Uncharacterized protein n=1 Tax=Phytophthora pseudosyringae TaxID=221518 RepID=A0A8T1VYC0_9STRA|nr:hypothetical protein PHYPSEUDO_000306 [Phytophthora pseudosyringae]